MSRVGVRQARCILCGAPCDGRTCRAHDGIEVDAVPADPLESLPMQAAETQPEVAAVSPVRLCKRCGRLATVTTLGGFLTIARCDPCEWYVVVSSKRLYSATNGTEPC